ncbi:MAG: ABC transporter permease [Pyrinomonadaceae bacterium]
MASRLRGVLAIILIAVLWEALSRASLINPNIIPPLSVVIETIFKETTQGRLVSDALHSLRRVLVGFGISAVLAISLGILAALMKYVGDLVRPIVDLIRPIPPIAWIPIALLWFGFGDPPAYFLVGLGAFFPIFTNAYLGVSLVEQETVEVALCHGASRQLLFREVILPQALPLIFVGLRTGLGVAWMVVITAELVGAQSGLGYMIQISRAQLQAEQVVAGMVVIGLIGFGLNRIMIMLARWFMPWRERGKSLLAEE